MQKLRCDWYNNMLPKKMSLLAKGATICSLSEYCP
jgi:hypothetical protein